MPLSRYDRYYGGKEGSGEKALRAMVERYGEKKGRRLFYGRANRAKRGDFGLRAELRRGRRG